MKTLVTLMLVYMLFSEALQASAALKCCKGLGPVCLSVECSAKEDRCMIKTEGILHTSKLSEKKCATRDDCDGNQKICCDTDLCNSAEGVKLSLLIMLVPLIFSTLFI
ncbi:hypothetical protein AOLI_G00155000 [Acnodon oligacanthus]